MEEVLQLLHRLQIPYHLHQHPPVFTCDQAKDIDSQLNSARTKNLFLVSEKTRNFYLYILECDQKADLKLLSKQLNETRLTFASPGDLQKILHLTPGSVSPFGLIHDTNHQVKVIIHPNVSQHQWVSFHPNTNTATLELSLEDFKKYLKYCNN